MNIENMFCCDTETGGFSATKDGLLSVALKVVGKDIKENIFLIPNNNLNYSAEALKVNGLNLEWLKENGVDELEAIDKIKTFLKTNFKGFDKAPTILGQNIKFDIKFIEALFKRYDESFEDLIDYQSTDTLTITKSLKASGKINIENAKLGTAYKYFTGKEPKDAHDAMGDVLMTEELYIKQLEFLNQ